ncbi:MAG: ribosome biogenesis GTP-binding protein YihA/YsxC [Nitrospinaceae bacterium]
MKIIRAEFITGTVSPAQYPRLPYPEVAFAGRSNVGKSSLINSLLNRKKLVKTSSTPGKTQMINFFNVNDRLLFADLPGYGFAKAPRTVREKWKGMLEGYLSQRASLKCVVLILDIRREPMEMDLQMQQWLQAKNRPYLLVATKADKLKAAERRRRLLKISELFLEGTEGNVIPYSSRNHAGRRELWTAMNRFAEFERISQPRV